jgi:oligosaccharyltransferase complex subunit delta (ribophorin II)
MIILVQENSLIWSLGTVELDLPDAPDGVQKPTATEIPSPYGPKPEIAHIFRQADKRAPSSLSTAFTVLTLLPLLGFLVGVTFKTRLTLSPLLFFAVVILCLAGVLIHSSYLLQLNVLDTNLKLFPRSGFPTAAALCFHTGIAAILGLYVLFWLKVRNVLCILQKETCCKLFGFEI